MRILPNWNPLRIENSSLGTSAFPKPEHRPSVVLRAQAVHQQTRSRHAGDSKLEMEQLNMNSQDPMANARTLIAGDKILLQWKGREHDNKYPATY
jgi:hypothetical protein